MRKIAYLLALIVVLTCPVSAANFTDTYIPEDAETYAAQNPSEFWNDLWCVAKDAITELRPEVLKAAEICLKVIGLTLLCSILYHLTTEVKFVSGLAVTIATGLLLFDSGQTLMELGKNTVQEITEYGKLMLPVLTSALAAQGAITTSSALYTGTALFSNLLSAAVSHLLIPLLYLYLCICIAECALADETLKRIREFIKWLMTWSLKIILYAFTGYMTVSGVISGTVDTSALKATKLAISGAVPVVGNILSDASETILLSAGVMKNSVGAYGLVVLISLLISPFLRIAVHYLLMKITAAVCTVFTGRECKSFVDDYATAMGYMLAMTGISCVFQTVGIVCMMKGVG